MRGDVLRDARLRKGWGLEELQKQSATVDGRDYIEISLNTIRKAENGGPCYPRIIRRLAEVLKIDPNELIELKIMSQSQKPLLEVGSRPTITEEERANVLETIYQRNINAFGYYNIYIIFNKNISENRLALLQVEKLFKILMPCYDVLLNKTENNIALFSVPAIPTVNHGYLSPETFRDCLRRFGAALMPPASKNDWTPLTLYVDPGDLKLAKVRRGLWSKVTAKSSITFKQQSLQCSGETWLTDGHGLGPMDRNNMFKIFTDDGIMYIDEESEMPVSFDVIVNVDD